MKKSLLFLIVLLAAGGVGWYVWRDKGAPVAESPVVVGDLPKLPDNSLEESSAPVADVPKDLKSRAMAIIARPILVKNELSGSAKESAIAKLKEISELIKQDYNTIYPWFDLGAYRKLIGDYDGAIEAWTFVITVWPKDFVAYHNLGDLYGFTLKNYPKSEEYFLKSIEVNPSNISGYLQLADLYEYAYVEKADQAEAILLKGLENNPGEANLTAALNSYRERHSKAQ
jgi:tetratricopeptide (TPR) repeat protein